MSTYQKADRELGHLVREIMNHHPELVRAGVTIGCLFAYGPRNNGKQTGPAIKVNGYEALGKIKINSLQDRVEGKADATLTVDGDVWQDHSAERQRAIIDHELEHIILRNGTDDVGRPKLGIRLHDLVVGGFSTIVGRHGPEAVEYQHVKSIADRHGQLLFQFMIGEPGVQIEKTRGKMAACGK